jgi:hypothetical protein
MKARRFVNTKVSLAVLLAATLTLMWTPAKAQIPPNSDDDLDGFSYQWEMAGCSYSPTANLIVPDAWPFFPGCAGSTQASLVDPGIADLFVILVQLPKTPLPPSRLAPTKNWLEYIEHVRALPPVHAHRIPRTSANLTAYAKKVVNDPSAPQLAVKVNEDSTSAWKAGYDLGKTTAQGTPNNLGDSFVYTKRIEDYVLSVYTQSKHDTKRKKCVHEDPKTHVQRVICQGGSGESWASCASNCVNGENCLLANLYEIYKKQVIAHEAGHKTKMTAYSNASVGGFHYASGTGVLMDQAVVVKETTDSVTFYIPTSHNDNDHPILK